MLFTPSQLQPENISINPNVSNTFTWQNNGSPQVAYQLFIYKNSDSSLVYTSNKITSANQYHTLPSSSLSSNLELKWQLRIWENSTSYIDSEYIFLKTNLLPTIALGSLPTNVQNFTFTATYSQSENVNLEKWKMVLYDSIGNVVSDSGFNYIYNITYPITGLITNTNYQIECMVWSVNGLYATTGKQSFTINYVYPESIAELNVTALDDEGGIQVDWGNIIQITGSSTGTINYVAGKYDNGIHINPSSNVEFDTTIPDKYTVRTYAKLPSGYSGDFIILGNNDYKVGYNNGAFYFNYQNYVSYSQVVSLPASWFLVAIKYKKVIIIADEYTQIIE